MKKEAISHGILDDLANRNDNWEKLDGVPEKVDLLMESKADKTYVDTKLSEKANKQQEAWIIPTLLNGFTGGIRYRINEFDNLEIIGSLTFTSNINGNSLPAFQLPMSYVPNWFKPGADYKDLRFKFSIPTDAFEARSARAVLSGYNGAFIITGGNNFNHWHINISIPMKV